MICSIKLLDENCAGCIDCKHSYIEDIWNELQCGLIEHSVWNPLSTENEDLDYVMVCEDYTPNK